MSSPFMSAWRPGQFSPYGGTFDGLAAARTDDAVVQLLQTDAIQAVFGYSTAIGPTSGAVYGALFGACMTPADQGAETFYPLAVVPLMYGPVRAFVPWFDQTQRPIQ
jgi:hypothetical protein